MKNKRKINNQSKSSRDNQSVIKHQFQSNTEVTSQL